MKTTFKCIFSLIDRAVVSKTARYRFESFSVRKQSAAHRIETYNTIRIILIVSRLS